MGLRIKAIQPAATSTGKGPELSTELSLGYRFHPTHRPLLAARDHYGRNDIRDKRDSLLRKTLISLGIESENLLSFKSSPALLTTAFEDLSSLNLTDFGRSGART